MREKEEKWSLFWCNLLHPVIFDTVEKHEINRYLKELCQKELVFPDGKRKKPSLSTLRRKLNRYKASGFESLARRTRSDIGKSRKAGPELIAKAIELKREQPRRSHIVINRMLYQIFGKRIPRTSLYRHLKNAGATRLKLGITKRKVRKRWTRDRTHDLWVGDFEEGPYVVCGDEVFPTHLSAFIDCHSRYVVEARYYYNQNMAILIDSLVRAWGVHGKSRELYLDNAKVYHSNGLKSACYALHINLIHRTAGDPAPGGLIERFFRTCQSQFESEVRVGDIMTLDGLNEAFSAWLNMGYHKEIHSEIETTPEKRYQEGLNVIRHVDMDDAIRFFMTVDYRTVDRVFSDIRLKNRYYQVDPSLRGDKVRIRYDPFSGMDSILLYSIKDDAWLGKGTLHDRKTGQEIPSSGQRKLVRNSYLELMINEHNKELEARSKGIDFRKAVQRRRWSFPSFTRKMAALMGRKGGMSAFNAKEHEMLKKAYNRMSGLNATLLTTAFELSVDKTLGAILYECQKLTRERSH